MGAVAVPYLAVASVPALQCVRMPTGLPGLFRRSSRPNPISPMPRLIRTSSSRIASASRNRIPLISATGLSAFARATASIRFSAQNRFTAVGREDARCAFSSRSAAWKASNVSASMREASRASPYAAQTPMAGAPRTCSRRMAFQISSRVRSSIRRTVPGRSVWSRMSMHPRSSGTRTEMTCSKNSSNVDIVASWVFARAGMGALALDSDFMTASRRIPPRRQRIYHNGTDASNPSADRGRLCCRPRSAPWRPRSARTTPLPSSPGVPSRGRIGRRTRRAGAPVDIRAVQEKV